MTMTIHLPESKHKVFVYGTLRPGHDATHYVQGWLYNLGWYPGLILDPLGAIIACEIIEADDEHLRYLDIYEGYNEKDPEGSLYIRREINVGGVDGFIYEYNRGPISHVHLIRSNDWREFNKNASITME
jgi:gamma-glutamylcyclotransferase (GGCT)/AIG2-like uncharacterized protein YtfP